MRVRKGNGRGDPWQEAWEAAREGPVAVVDCDEEIPCNPCEEACRRGCIRIGENICAVPRYDPRRCNGCARCVAVCPGMAIFLLDRSGPGGAVRVTVPYEMGEELEPGKEAWAVDARGNPLGKGSLVRAVNTGGTVLATVEVPGEWALKVRGVRVRIQMVETPEEVEMVGQEGGFPFCRCEEIPYSRVREIVGMGFRSLAALRRFSRVGLGSCQGRYCQSMLRDEFLAASSGDAEGAGAFRARPPVRPVKLSRLGGDDG